MEYARPAAGICLRTEFENGDVVPVADAIEGATFWRCVTPSVSPRLFLGLIVVRLWCQVFDDAIAANHDGGTGRSCQLMRASSGTLHGLLRKSQVAVLGVFDGMLVHGRSLQSMSTGTEPALSYNAHAFTCGA